MDLIFKCPKCSQELEVDSSGAGEEIECPSCASRIRIPHSDAAPAPPAPASSSAPVQAGVSPELNPMSTSAAAKIEMHLKVPVHRGRHEESLIAKALPPLEVAAKTTDRQLRVRIIRHLDCVEVGHDRFEEVVTNFLGKIGEANLVNCSTVAYTYIDISTQKILTDFGVLILYRG